ncbi:Protein crumbs [Cryptotermes secundus]|uniref:Protein crumbs n=2 Tax=Cryptotermes secundus TaxID=105785 RepID=A0A2J7R7D1_9NEOP|nr:protein crumbs isoform X1 [Cryptotermes secundus]PNF36740.1 Protein crumbs [Cryptotermes secundus]
MSIYGSRCLSASACLISVALLLHTRNTISAQQSEGFFNGSSYVRLFSPISLHGHTGLSFRTCVGGELFSQTNGGNSISLDVQTDRLLFSVMVQGQNFDTQLNVRFLDNNWHTVNLLYRLGNLTLSVMGHSQVVANSTYNSEVLNHPELSNENSVLIVGKGFTGCLLEGPSIVFSRPLVQAHNVEWGPCPHTINSCTKMDHCRNKPCLLHGECISLPDRYECKCAAGYSGNNCEINNGSPCRRNNGNPCRNNGRCEEDAVGNYHCFCEGRFTGVHCETEISSHLCESNPCQNNGSCHVLDSNYECTCLPGFTGQDCETNINECLPNPCLHGGNCVDGINNYTCLCGRTGYKGMKCEQNINECENNPCLNQGSCFDTYGSYTCQCMRGFGGQNCELNLKECSSNPCRNGGVCKDSVGSYECQCFPGFTGTNCEVNINECEPGVCPADMECVDGVGTYQCVCRSGYPGTSLNCTGVGLCHSTPCLNGGICTDLGDRYNCKCPAGFSGVHCERASLLDWCIAVPCRNGGTCMGHSCECPPQFTGHACETIVQCSTNPCQHSSKCLDYSDGYYCECDPGWTGPNCENDINECHSNPCRNAGTCVDTINGFYCECASGFTGNTCSVNIDECASGPCQNGGICIDHVHGYKCNCSEDFMGDNCELEYDVCGLLPCRNNGTCISIHNKRDYQCRCLSGFEGANCEVNIDDCVQASCPDNKVCIDGVNDYDCRCRQGFTGDNCTTSIDFCEDNPCQNNATCANTYGNYTCICPVGISGRDCEHDIDECSKSPEPCNNGICVNSVGSYLCFCSPGFTGDHCDLDIDECLSQPCRNNATCENRINSYHCVCTPGFTGKDCGIDINECASVPCKNGATCIDDIAAFRCVCPPGLTGTLCEIDIDDCEPLPCHNDGVCVDGINSFLCNCSDTGYEGYLCEKNIDDCLTAPCTNGAECHDGIKDYNCSCFEGYAGKNCEIDIDECESSPCQYGGTCLERSNQSLYRPAGSQPALFPEKFNYMSASGYKCVCVPGITGENCEINVNECDPEPCIHGSCKDVIGSYECECEDGYEGTQCEIEIDECERYTPCVHGTCSDRKANYYCDCEPKYGGKNCSVELTGCLDGPCLNNGTCKPYLENETNQKYNCSCPNGFHGQNCTEVTTMSLNGSSLILVNTTREEGYDIQFRFKTTLSNGLLAIGKGSTFYILELVHGKLNLHSSLLNKWEGVFIGSKLSDSNWQKVFVAINSSHLVLAANEEQTIYPINLNEATNVSYTSFPTTYLGGTLPYLSGLTHGPASFIGCTEDVVINGEWVLPNKHVKEAPYVPITLMGVEVGCPREDQCKPNPCHNGGTCTDLWRNFTCACERPYLGHTCQYNLTAATFGHENITESLVTVMVNDRARRSIRNVVDISMFIRTRQEDGTIFYLGSSSGIGSGEETFILAQLDAGELLVKIQFSGTLEKYTVGGQKLADGYNHLIQVVRNVTLVQVKMNGTEYFRKTISATGPLDVNVLYLGGMPQMGRTIRQVEAIPDRSEITKPPVNFKGIIQDVQISNGNRIMVVEFFPLGADDLEIPPPFGTVSFDKTMVLEGVVSDNSCRSNPCEHSGTCFVTWNDFSCECPRGYKGKMCQEMEFCQLQNCPLGSTCQNLDNGYECIANATFDGHNTSLSYSLHVTSNFSIKQLDTISITYRSRTGGTMLYINSGTEFFSVSVYNDEVTVAWKFNVMPLGQVYRFRKDEPDGNWTTVLIRMDNNGIMGKFSFASEDTAQSFSASVFPLESWKKLVTSSKIILGGRAGVQDNIAFADGVSVSSKHSYVTFGGEGFDTLGTGANENRVDYTSLPTVTTSALPSALEGAFFKGCLGEVRIGGLLLPYFTPDQLYSDNSSTQDSFELSAPRKRVYDMESGCRLCFESECSNGGHCADPAESYVCNCSAGFEGDGCTANINECEQNRCENNATCIDGIANYTCHCQQGWEGWLCDVDIDECTSNPCQHGGTCINGLGKFECNCTDEYMGLYCENFKLITCDNSPCLNGSTCTDVKNSKTGDNFTCTCMEGFVGPVCNKPYCMEQPCQHGGTCDLTGVAPLCRCYPGYRGKYCEEDINECAEGPDKASPCKNGANCTDGINNYICNCSGTGYKGLNCTEDIDECTRDLFLCGAGSCVNIPGSFRCQCPEGKCGSQCADDDPCSEKPCKNGGICFEKCDSSPGDYYCECPVAFKGKNCTEMFAEEASHNAVDIAIIVAPIVGLILLVAAVGLSVFITMARKKRATRGTYSPSQQEYCNPRVEMDNVMKPPPEERLI